MRCSLVLLSILLAAPAWAGEHVPPVSSESVRKECGSCHMAFQPQFLPRDSWRKIMGRLPRHFGSEVHLSKKAHHEVETYHLENAADVSATPEGLNFVESIANRPAPLRITHVPHWAVHHRGVVDEAGLLHRGADSKIDCRACHRSADSGYYQGN